MEEDVIYSEGESFKEDLYPDNTWDSDDSIYDNNEPSFKTRMDIGNYVT